MAGESPDAIGFRVSELRDGGGSTVVECKVSRSDFLADQKKPHRTQGAGMGRFRYFMVPEGMLSADEVPSGWGLIYVGERNRIQIASGAALSIREPGAFSCWHDSFSETLLLANLLHRVGNPERLNARLRSADAQNANLIRAIDRERKRADEMQRQFWELKTADMAREKAA
ncbi:hypothetical protein ACELLULO517_07455 [Acidisoma cellulosilytica]|uniref:Adenylosuccinate synthase n=1 Tax=Acidisoma cellulosilyticum TaxID=2802395 RepID=A0A964E343_9PROT|nr:hypothetical protein [Acidisoma cellulosilyticum]MCB8880066.1 hypothetical protein [Acidisoma cellulosilyticum]